MTKRIEARESVGYRQTWTIGQSGAPLDISGWTFAAQFQRQAGSPEFSLGMAGSLSDAVEGFFVVSGPNGQLSITILPATLQAIADTTGDFTLYGDLLGTPPGQVQLFMKAIELRVTTTGPWP